MYGDEYFSKYLTLESKNFTHSMEKSVGREAGDFFGRYQLTHMALTVG